jgi:uncharacterized membrane protein
VAFHESLSARDRRLATRLESLGDVVVGFAMSQLVIQLPQLGKAIHVRDAFHIVAYFVTFAVLVTLWLSFHRMMTQGFKPGRLDLSLAFVYLAFTSLMPYAMNANFAVQARLGSGVTAAEASWGIAVYCGCFFATLATSAAIYWRNLQRAWYTFDDEERDSVWLSALRTTSVGTVMLIILAADFVAGPERASFFFALLFIPAVIIRKWFKKAPRIKQLQQLKSRVGDNDDDRRT